ncbi:regulator of microtubule dynamics protein 2-like isoform X2 [Carassius auratus]|uniref:Regulator of microtubule dynamics protein 2 n=1 Tax=Carassius auratus TaxID=7957 RepID=A0A6P6QKX4_CARAU|nr:regulator of microtubule dynamics protein 2-like isoform X2 [Carassius auratus]
MAQADSRALALGVLAGAAGITLAIVCFRKIGAGSGRVLHLSRSAGSLGLQTSQAEVLDQLGALIHCVSELREEVKALKDALPQLQDSVRDQLRGRRGDDISAHKASPLHQTPSRRKRAGGGGRSEGQSSEEAESEGGYITALTDSEEEESGEYQKPLQEPVDELTALLRKADRLHSCNGAEKAQGLNALLERKAEFDQKCQYLWRLSRAYADAHDFALDRAEKKSCAENGKTVGEKVISINPLCAEGHQWYAIHCGLLSEYESIQNKIKNAYLFKVSQCTWIERKIATTLFGEPPSATVQDALHNFLKAEEISPQYSKFNYVFLAKCYKDLGQRIQAQQMCDAASAMSIETYEDEEAQKELEALVASL